MHLFLFSTTMLRYQVWIVSYYSELQGKMNDSNLQMLTVAASDCVTTGTNTHQKLVMLSDQVKRRLETWKKTNRKHLLITLKSRQFQLTKLLKWQVDRFRNQIQIKHNWQVRQYFAQKPLIQSPNVNVAASIGASASPGKKQIAL